MTSKVLNLWFVPVKLRLTVCRNQMTLQVILRSSGGWDTRIVVLLMVKTILPMLLRLKSSHSSQTSYNSQKHGSPLTIYLCTLKFQFYFSQQPNSNPFLNIKHFSEFTFVFKLLLSSLLSCKETKAQMPQASFPRTRTNKHAKFVIWT